MLPLNWPTDLPEDCPPEDSVAANGTYFRIVKSNPPVEADFASVYEINRKRAERQIRLGRRSECETMGLSVYSNIDDAVECARQFPGLGGIVAELDLSPDSGRTLLTVGGFASHNTWWKPADFNPLPISRAIIQL